MQEIQGKTKNIQELLSGASYGIDYYQREYKWKTKQLSELLDDLTTRFFEDYRANHTTRDVANYGHYFLGSIVVSQANDIRQVVDGQQRLTTLTLLLIYLNNRQKASKKKVGIENLIYDDDFGEKSFKLSIPERNACMEALFNETVFDPQGTSESVENLHARYSDIDELLSDDLKDDVLALFIYWLIRKVQLVEITAYDDEDAYTIFETMNDRGLALTPTDMLKGYLLANIDNSSKRLEANKLIKRWLLKFSEYGKDTESDFFKTWLRAQYARKIRERKKNAKPEDFDLIGTEYHRWVRNHEKLLNLKTGNDYFLWISHDFDYFSRIYELVMQASKGWVEGWESVRFNADNGFTQQFLVLLAPLLPKDNDETVKSKVKVVADYIDCWLTLRIWNFKSISYSTLQYTVFQLCKEIRGLPLGKLRQTLKRKLKEELTELDFTEELYLHGRNAKQVHRLLARMTHWVEVESKMPGRYQEYIVRSGKNAYEIEHIWANHYSRYKTQFGHQKEFEEYRNYLGGLLLLPKKINASLNDATYKHKLQHYLKQNILASSLHEKSYENEPGFKKMIKETGLPFKEYSDFNIKEFEERQALYSDIAAQVWCIERLDGSAE